ncbi:alpha-mannosyltransferase [Aspergillus clavatus NRRL 1]|uniref:Alpha-1,2-mannosyltransferase, putative n=1 Tax=Aspergillus clavatus (strain ATCC 1007 / CBS 513.65 / DSM 816 / NCTC 3887 / NRRL 1 / QM 1276 / 107) TaxID=344612 RepID=A1CBP4_ASPCL|nr:alpha-1,2-mannosyltransferase, putative [Aspergillus clavatus NRRL 1]EAW13162.1 alpha-1,2-mannosyltransferase, putative [Aspergillus clavatus NRRL 1]
MAAFRFGRLRSLLLAMGAIFLISTFYLYWTPAPASMIPSTAFEVPLTERQIAFWKVLKPILEKNTPKCPPPTRRADAPAMHFNPNATDPRLDLILLKENDRKAMEEAHASYLQDIRDAKRLRPPHTTGTRGLVTTAGKSYLPLVVSSLRMLRRTGSTLPAEVYMKDASEYEKKICENVLPSLDARCLVLSEIVGKEPIAHYQLKAFAVLFSSFEEIIWMDADCFPLHKPEELFEVEPFKSNGLVTWPDFWASTASPAYFELSHQPIPPMSVRQSSETGIFMVSKKTNYITLLLAAYYNYYGPSHYFRLLSQGAPGEGDKETFLQAAAAVGEPFYAVSERVQALGHWKPDNQGLSGSAMAQADPREDYALTSQDKWRVRDPSVGKPPRVFFIHAHYPKFNPAENLFGSKWETAPTLKADGSEGRAWTAPEDVVSRFGYDAEKNYWEEIKWLSCDPKTEFRTWETKAQVCQQVESYWQHVFAEPHPDDPKFTDEA